MASSLGISVLAFVVLASHARRTIRRDEAEGCSSTVFTKNATQCGLTRCPFIRPRKCRDFVPQPRSCEVAVCPHTLRLHLSAWFNLTSISTNNLTTKSVNISVHKGPAKGGRGLPFKVRVMSGIVRGMVSSREEQANEQLQREQEIIIKRVTSALRDSPISNIGVSGDALTAAVDATLRDTLPGRTIDLSAVPTYTIPRFSGAFADHVCSGSTIFGCKYLVGQSLNYLSLGFSISPVDGLEPIPVRLETAAGALIMRTEDTLNDLEKKVERRVLELEVQALKDQGYSVVAADVEADGSGPYLTLGAAIDLAGNSTSTSYQ